MITQSGTGSHASEALFDTSALEPGFYQVGARFTASGLPTNAGLLLTVTTPSGYPPVTVAVSSAQPASANASGAIYLEAGAALAFSVTPFGPMGSATPPWTAKFFLYRATDIS